MLLVVGDGHTRCWNGGFSNQLVYSQVKIRNIFRPCAKDLMVDEGTLADRGVETLEVIRNHNDETTAIMLSYGEIDIKYHIIKNAILNKSTIFEETRKIVQNYFYFIRLVALSFKRPVFVWAPMATSTMDIVRKLVPKNEEIFEAHGSEIERNSATRCFNDLLTEYCAELDNVFIVSIFDEMTVNSIKTLDDCFEDDAHVNDRGHGIAVQKFRDIVKTHHLNLPDYFDKVSEVIHATSHSAEIAIRSKIIRTSSNFDSVKSMSSCSIQGANKVITVGGMSFDHFYIFHTEADDQPYALIDLGYTAVMREMYLFNRFDGFKERARTIEVHAGSDLSNLDVIYRHDGSVFGTQNEPLRVGFGEDYPGCRFIKLLLREKTNFHLGDILIFAQTFL